MNASRTLGLLLIVAGVLALIYGGFTYPKSHEARVGSLAVSMTTDKTVYIPIWAGAGAVLLGGLLLLVGGRKIG